MSRQQAHCIKTPAWVFAACCLLAFVFQSETSCCCASEQNEAKPTFSGAIASIIYQRCSGCHRPGQSGPFSLLDYSQVTEHAETIAAVIQSGYMPPWKPIDHGIDFANNRQLSEAERASLLKWIEDGCPLGDKNQIPPAPTFPADGWQLGKPDLIVKLSEAFEIPADGPDLYRSFSFPIGLPEDKWIKSIELRPTARGAVHHALFFVDADGNAKYLKSRDGQPGFVGMNFLRGRGNVLERVPESMSRGLGGYVPGAVPNLLPGDLARLLPAKSDIVMQTHFHPSGKKELEQSELGLYFADKPPSQQLVSIQVPPMFGMGAGIDIPAGKSDYHVQEAYRLPIAIRGVEISGHAHYLCKKMVMKANLPNGESLALLEIPDWDLDWQDQYIYSKPIYLPEQTELVVDLWYDNSSSNPKNPFSPPQRITWGRESTDEMGSITLLAIAADESDRATLDDDRHRHIRNSLANRIRSQLAIFGGLGANAFFGGAIIKTIDKNQDGDLDSEELPARMRERLLDLFDQDGDDRISPQEIESGKENIKLFLEANDRPTPKKTSSSAKPSDEWNNRLKANQANKVAMVLVFVRTDCPIANAYQPKLDRIRARFETESIDWVMVYPQPGLTEVDTEKHLKEFGIRWTPKIDSQHKLVNWARVSVTPEAVVVDPNGKILYRGRIDDLYEDYGKKRKQPTRNDLEDAIEAMVQGQPIETQETKAIGCIISRQ